MGNGYAKTLGPLVAMIYAYLNPDIARCLALPPVIDGRPLEFLLLSVYHTSFIVLTLRDERF